MKALLHQHGQGLEHLLARGRLVECVYLSNFVGTVRSVIMANKSSPILSICRWLRRMNTEWLSSSDCAEVLALAALSNHIAIENLIPVARACAKKWFGRISGHLTTVSVGIQCHMQTKVTEERNTDWRLVTALFSG